MSPSRPWRIVAPSIAVFAVTSCGGGGSTSPPPPPPPAAVATVTVTPSTATLVPLQTAPLTATVKDAAGNTLSGRTVAWTSNANAVASVSAAGLVSAVAVGAATISATSEGQSGTAAITVANGAVIGAVGGTVNGAGGAVSLVIPAGALSQPTAITVDIATSFPASPLLAGQVYALGPTGTQFAQPVTLRLAYNPAQVPAGMPQAVLRPATATATGWAFIDGGSVDTMAHTVSSAITHFSMYAAMGPPLGILTTDEDQGTIFEALTSVSCEAGTDVTVFTARYDPSLPNVATATSDHPNIASPRVWGPVRGLNNRIITISCSSPGIATITIEVGQATATLVVTVTAPTHPPLPVAVLKDDAGKQTPEVVSNGAATPLTTASNATAVAVAPDATWAAWLEAATVSTPASLVAAPISSGNPGLPSVLLHPPLNGGFFGLAFPTPTSIDYSVLQPGGSGQANLFSIPSAGGTPVQIGPTLPGILGPLAVSPDGKAIYVAYGPPNLPYHLVTIDATTGAQTPTQITTGSLFEYQPAGSRNGSMLAFEQFDAFFTFSQVLVRPIDPAVSLVPAPSAGEQGILISPPTGFAISPSWCGNRFVYFSYRATAQDPYAVWRYSLADGTSGPVPSFQNLFPPGIGISFINLPSNRGGPPDRCP